MRKDKKNKAKVPYNIPMVMACVLFCCTLVSMHFTSDLYARYTTSDESSDGARTATFGQLTLTETVNGEQVTDMPAKDIAILPGIVIDSEVYLEYTGGETDVYIFVAVDGGWNWTTSAERKLKDANDLMFFNVKEGWTYYGGLKNGEQVFYTYVDANNSWQKSQGTHKYFMEDITVNTWILDSTIYHQIADLKLNYRAIVVQAGGFASADEAWTAVNS